jgi:hypothetical protein
VPEPLRTRLQTLTVEQVEVLVEVALTSQSLAEFADQAPTATGETATTD